MKRLEKSNLKLFKYTIWAIMDRNNKQLNGFMFYNNELIQINVKIENI